MSILSELVKAHPVRRSETEKTAFRQYVIGKATERGLPAKVELTADGKNNNVVIGDPESAKIIYTAHYDTPCASPFPNMMIPRNRVLFFAFQFVPIIIMLAVALSVSGAVRYAVGWDSEAGALAWYFSFLAVYYLLFWLFFRGFVNKNNYNDNTSGVAVILSVIEKCNPETLKNAAFILFDNEEKGKKGSKAYFSDHREMLENKLLLNFDCVGNGENIVFIAKEKAEKMPEYVTLKEAFASKEGFNTEFYPIKGSESNSDYKNFPCGVGCMACKKSKNGVLYTPRIHTGRDTEAHDENIEFISNAAIGFIERVK